LAAISLEPPRATGPVLSETVQPDMVDSVSGYRNGKAPLDSTSVRPPMAVTPASALRVGE
jgi:hypothetical protein